MPSFDDVLRLYDFLLPPGRIATHPASPRDSAKLLVYDRKNNRVTWSIFRDIGTFLPAKSLLVLNETKVIPARLFLQRQTGGTVALLWLGQVGPLIRVLSNRKLKSSETLSMDDHPVFTVEGSQEKEWLLRPVLSSTELDDLFAHKGHMPLPPYIKNTPLSEEELKTAYQTVFAKNPGSIAAPTASLHFTDRLLKELGAQGIEIATVTLHVHLGTFAPLTEEQWQTGRLHHEEYHIEPAMREKIERAKSEGRPIVAVGTTAVRTLESASNEQGKIVTPDGTTDLFIREGYRFRMVDALVTNFHVPRSSLLMLVGAFMGREKLLELYTQAIDHDFRFFSFGDAMLIV